MLVDVFTKLSGNQLVNLGMASFGIGSTLLVIGFRELHRAKTTDIK